MPGSPVPCPPHEMGRLFGFAGILSTHLKSTAFAYLFCGQATFGTKEVAAARLVIFCDGTQVQGTAPANQHALFIFVSVTPLKEPVLQYCHLVMNTIEEMKTGSGRP